MAVFRAFRALRPVPEKAALVAAVPYDVVSREEAQETGAKNSFSFLHVDRAEIDLPKETAPYDESVYEKARENLFHMEEEGTLLQDETDCYYLYELTRRKGKVQTGIAGCSSVDDYLNHVIKTHERTRAEKEMDRICHVEKCNAHTGPVYLAAEYPAELVEFMEKWKAEHPAVYDFVAEDQVTHRMWVIEEKDAISYISDTFGKISSLYIADGHHRAAAAAKVAKKRREEHLGYTGEEDYNYFLSVVFPREQLTILPYHRIVKDLNGLQERAFIASLKFNFELMIMPGFPCKPVEKHSMGMYVGGEWYLLRAWPDIYEKKAPVEKLDVSILQDKILSPILGIDDPRNDERIQFAGGTCKLRELASMAGETGGVAFAMYPASMEELMEIAELGEQMPPKSTWFEPKLLSGLLIHKLG